MTATTSDVAEATNENKTDQEPQKDKESAKVTPQLVELGLTNEDIESFKRQYGAVAIATIGGKPYLYRQVRRSELRQIRQLQVSANADFEMIAQEKIASRCTIAPKITEEGLRESGAGLASTLSELIYALSDFDADAPPVRL